MVMLRNTLGMRLIEPLVIVLWPENGQDGGLEVNEAQRLRQLEDENFAFQQ